MTNKHRYIPLLPIFALCAAFGCTSDDSAPAGCPPPGEWPASEACIRAELGIPVDAERVLILSQSSHLDWDWLLDFEGYFVEQVDEVFLDATDLLTTHEDAFPNYYYSIAEVGFLEAFYNAHPDIHPALEDAGHRLRIVGGGITSPDNLLPNGETFMRDYLVGKTWVDRNLPRPIRQTWIPDDFGHDSNLPIVLQAMGMLGVGFARVPGADTNATFNGFSPPDDGTMAAEMRANMLDFVWRAPDGSEVIAHWMPESYCQGDKIDMVSDANFMDLMEPDATEPEQTNARIREFLSVNEPGSPTPYIFVPVGCDFTDPKAGLPDYVAAWNETEYETTGIYAALATFDHYVQLLDHHRDELEVREFDPTPYWMGYYASKPLIKTKHHEATDALLAAEVFGAIADGLRAADAGALQTGAAERAARVHDGWAKLVPSNHHDYITGTSVQDVYEAEHIPLIEDALAVGVTERDAALTELAAAITAEPAAGESAVAVFNSLGFARSGLATMANAQSAAPVGVRTDAGTGAVQQSVDGGLLLTASAPGYGWSVAYLGSEAGAEPHAATVGESSGGDVITLENEYLRASIERAAAWGVTSLVDLATGESLVRGGDAAVDLVVYKDGGGIYRFGHELDNCAFDPYASAVSSQTVTGAARITEDGPLRVSVRTTITMEGIDYVREYSLTAGEPFLRIHAAGAAPEGSTVMVRLPLAGLADELLYGTPYHWTVRPPERIFSPSFEATHEFVAPRVGGAPVFAVYRAGIPAWALDTESTPAGDEHALIGALWRNTPSSCEFYGADSRDDDEHKLDFAIRVPSGVGTPEDGIMLREALAFRNPLVALPAGGGTLPSVYSLASVGPLPAILRTAKTASNSPTELVLRVYQPTNAPLDVAVTTASAERFPVGARLTLRPVTTLEQWLAPADYSALDLTGDAREFSFTAERALTTLSIGY